MAVVEQNVGQAPWLPRMADFEAYNGLFEDYPTPGMSPTPPLDEPVSQPVPTVLTERTNGNNVPVSESAPTTPRAQRKVDGNRRSLRKSKKVSVDGVEPEVVPYKPRRSKYDID
jgi:hypothetical protein